MSKTILKLGQGSKAASITGKGVVVETKDHIQELKDSMSESMRIQSEELLRKILEISEAQKDQIVELQIKLAEDKAQSKEIQNLLSKKLQTTTEELETKLTQQEEQNLKTNPPKVFIL